MDHQKTPEPSKEMIALYKQHIPEYLDNLKSAVAAQDQEGVDFECHKMTSAMRIMGFETIATILDQIKDDDVNSESVRDLLVQVEIMIDHTLKLLNED